MVAGLILGFAPSQWETVLLCNNVSHWLGASLKSALWKQCGEYLGQESKPGVSATHWTVTDLVPASLLVYWTMTDPVPAGLSSTQVSSNRQRLQEVSTCPPQVPDICPPGLVMGANWVIHYKVVLPADGSNSLVLACEWSEIWGYFFFLWGKFLVVRYVEIYMVCSFGISISLYFHSYFF